MIALNQFLLISLLLSICTAYQYDYTCIYIFSPVYIIYKHRFRLESLLSLLPYKVFKYIILVYRINLESI